MIIAKFVGVSTCALLLLGMVRSAHAEQWSNVSAWTGSAISRVIPDNDPEAGEAHASLPPHADVYTNHSGALADAVMNGERIFTWSGPGVAAKLTITIHLAVTGYTMNGGTSNSDASLSGAAVRGGAPTEYPPLGVNPVSLQFLQDFTLTFLNFSPGTVTVEGHAQAHSAGQYGTSTADANASQ